MAQTLKFGNGTWATKKGSTLAYNDENDNYKPLPFTTTRASGATRVNKEGLIEVVENDRPRIDYTDSAKGALLLEPQSTNLFTYSEDFSNADWSKTNVTLVSDNGVSPDGTSNSDLIYPTATDTNFTYVYNTVNNVSVSQYTISAFVKSSGVNVAWLYIQSVGSVGSVYFDLSDESIQIVNGNSNTLTAEITSVSNGWYKISCTNVTPIAITSGHGIGISDAKGSRTITKNGTNGMLIYGAMLEQGSYPTSYIPTQGATATRLADTASGSGNSEVFNDSEGVLFADMSTFVDDNLNRQISISNGTTANSIKLTFIDEDTLIFERRTSSGDTQDSIDFVSGNFTKIAFQYKSNNYKAFFNGFEINLTQSVNLPTGLNTLNFDNGAGGGDFYGKTKEIGYYDEILTDLELETLTSYSSLSELVTELNLNTL